METLIAKFNCVSLRLSILNSLFLVICLPVSRAIIDTIKGNWMLIALGNERV